MIKERIHPQGPAFSRIIAGAWRWRLEPAKIERLVQTSLDQEITSIDHADIYGDYSIEELFGKVLKKNPTLRNRMELITKCGIKLLSAAKPENRIKHYDSSKDHILQSVESSLQKLSTDRIDLLLIHRPDPLMNPDEIAEAFEKLRQQGKVLHFGVSNFTTAQFEMLQQSLSFPLVTNQIEISLFHHDALFNGIVDTLLKHRVSPLAWSPLGGGKYFENDTMKPMHSMSEKYKCSATQLLLAWLLRHPARLFPIIGTTNPDRINEAAASIHVHLERQDWFELLKGVTGKDVA